MKKLLSLFIAFCIVFTSVITVSASGETTSESSENMIGSVAAEYFDISDRPVTETRKVLVISYNSDYLQKDEKPSVFLDVYTDSEFGELERSVEIPKDLISVDIFKRSTGCLAEVFVTVPNDFDADRSKTVVRVSDLVFLTDDGEITAEVEKAYRDFKRGAFSFACVLNEAVNRDEGEIEILVGSEVLASNVVIHGKYSTSWTNRAVINYYYEGELIESQDGNIVADKLGDYTIEFYLNDQFRSTKSFSAVNGVKRYFEVLLESTWHLITSPLYLIGGILVGLIPGFTMVLGAASVYSAFYSIPNFFKTLFGQNTTFGHYYS